MTHSSFCVRSELPPCSNCGAHNYVAGIFPVEGQLFRCEECRTCFKPASTVTLTATIEPAEAPSA